MSRPLWRILLEQIGKFRLPFARGQIELSVGVKNALDANGSTMWGEFARSEKLFAAWSPISGSVWEPYHCAPLFAALDQIPVGRRGVASEADAKAVEEPLKPLVSWLKTAGAAMETDTLCVIDLPGPRSVALAIPLIELGLQPVCTFDHWPHPAGLLQPENILAQLLRHASTVNQLRKRLRRDAPPVWICDCERLGKGPGRPSQFDNRYYLDDSILPGISALRGNSISRILYITPTTGQNAVEDFAAYFDLVRKNGIRVEGIAVDSPKQGVFNVPKAPAVSKYKAFSYARAAAGGFGKLIPAESSSSG